MRKPEERIFRLAAGRLGLSPAECVFVDDVEGNIAAARRSASPAVHHQDSAQTRPAAAAAGAAQPGRLARSASGIPTGCHGGALAARAGTSLMHYGRRSGCRDDSRARHRGRVSASVQRRPVGEHAGEPAHRHQARAGAAAGAARARLPLPQGLPARPGRRGRVRPDIVFTARQVAVFVDGCFWHCCPEHGSQPAANTWYWEPKLRRNVDTGPGRRRRARPGGLDRGQVLGARVARRGRRRGRRCARQRGTSGADSRGLSASPRSR